MANTPPPGRALEDMLADYALAEEREQAKARAQAQHDHVLEQLLTKDWAHLTVLEQAGELLFPEKIYRRSLQGAFVGEDVLLRVPREKDFREARVQAREIAISNKLDLDRDKDLIEQLETTCILWRCVLNASPGLDRAGKPFHEPWVMEPLELEKRYDRVTLTQLWAKLDALVKVIDPRIEQIGKEEVLAMLSAIAKARSISPLHVYGPAAQNTFIVTTADLVLSLLAIKS